MLSLCVALFCDAFYGTAAQAQTQSTQACLSTYESTQRLLKRGDLQGAHAAAVVCSQPECERLLSQDCRRWLNEIEERQPSVTLTFAKGLSANDLQSVSVGATTFTMPWDGRAVAVNPGRQEVRVKLQDGFLQREEMVVSEGIRGQVILVQGRTKPLPVVTDPVAQNIATPDTAPGHRFLRVAVTGGATVGLATFAAFGIKGLLHKRDLQDDCAPDCSPNQKAKLERDFLIADLGLGAGLVLGVCAAWLWWRAGDSQEATTALASWSLAAGPRGSALLYRGHF